MDIISVPARHALHIAEPKLKLDLTKYVEHHEYFFDQVFEDNVSNEQVAFREETKDKHTLASCRLPAKASGSKDEHALFGSVRKCSNLLLACVPFGLLCGVQVYMQTIRDMVEFVFQRGKATCFAFGRVQPSHLIPDPMLHRHVTLLPLAAPPPPRHVWSDLSLRPRVLVGRVRLYGFGRRVPSGLREAGVKFRTPHSA
jgi:hypothetical protein